MSAGAVSGAVSGAIVAGGRSMRLGTDKRLVAVSGTPLLARTAAVLRPLVDDLQVVVARAEDGALVTELLGTDLRVGVDARDDAGPAAGLEAALAGARHDLVLVLATDHPVLVPDVLALLIARARTSPALAVALAGPHGGEPFLAVYRRSALPTVRAALDAGVRRMQAMLGELSAELVDEAEWRALDPTGATLDDVDVPADLVRLETFEDPGRVS
jgi:molybdopterin-guanine dinucleotide biosynthesis protein A